MDSSKPVDRVEVLVLIDNKTDSLSSVPVYATLEWKNLMKAGMRQLGGSCQCCANHGLALIVTAYRGSNKQPFSLMPALRNSQSTTTAVD